MTLGQRIKNKRESMAMTQTKLAEKSFISASYISRIESGSSNPSRETLYDIAKALNVPPQELLCDDFTYSTNSSTAEKIKVMAEKFPPEIQQSILETLEIFFSHLK